jgi:hypothetical protein
MINANEITPECVGLTGAIIDNEYYQQFSLRATTSNCRWSYKLTPPEICSTIAAGTEICT